MGCTQSKIENEEAVTRCKDRKQFMKEAVSARNAFAAAHSAYTMSLKNTGAALSDYAHGEVQNPQDIALNHHASQALPPPPSVAPPPMDSLVPPPPPPNLREPLPPIHRATSLPAINLSERKENQSRERNGVAAGTIVEEEEEEEEGVESSQEKLITRKRSSGRNRAAAAAGGDHQSAVENSRAMQQDNSAYDYFFNSMENMPAPTLEDKEEREVIEQKVFDEMPKRVEEEEKAPAEVEPPAMEEEKQKVVEEEVEAPPPPIPESAVGVRSLKKGKAGGGMGGMVEKRGGKASVNLLQVFVELDDHFLKASESAHEVSKMLEATRLHYHSNFADNRGNSELVVLGMICK